MTFGVKYSTIIVIVTETENQGLLIAVYVLQSEVQKKQEALTVKKIGKSTFFIVVAIIALFSVLTLFGVDYRYGDIPKTYIKGVDDIRLGIDIKGGVDATFEPADDFDASEDQLNAAT